MIFHVGGASDRLCSTDGFKTMPTFLLYQNREGVMGIRLEQRSTSRSFSFYKRLYYPRIKGVFNKP